MTSTPETDPPLTDPVVEGTISDSLSQETPTSDTLIQDLPTMEDQINTDQLGNGEVEELTDGDLEIFLTEDSDTFLRTLSTLQDMYKDEKFDEEIAKPNSFASHVATAFSNHSYEGDRIADSIKDIADKQKFSDKLIIDGRPILGSSISRKYSPKEGDPTTIVLSGPNAAAEMNLISGDVKRIFLYNSGITIDIVTPLLLDLNSFFNRAGDIGRQYGRLLGYVYYLYHGVFVKESIVELLRGVIKNSSLVGWRENNMDNLFNVLKMNDYASILVTMAAMMHPTGHKFRHTCLNTACGHSDAIMIDINKLRRHDFGKLNGKAVKHMVSRDPVTAESLAEYHASLGFDRPIVFDKYTFNLSVPSVNDYLEYGRFLANSVIEQNFTNRESQLQAASVAYYRAFIPFIKSYSIALPEGRIAVTEEQDAIAAVLDKIQSTDRESSFAVMMENYIKSTEISHICYPVSSCPKCSKIPNIEGGFFGVDPERVFFTTAQTKLIQS